MRHLGALILSFMFSTAVHANLKNRVSVSMSQDRWITFADGGRLFHGLEVSPLLIEALFQSGQFVTVVEQHQEKSWARALDRLPSVQFESFQSQDPYRLIKFQSKAGQQDPFSQLTVRPQIQSLVFESGSGSNRIQLGFKGEDLHPFNMGAVGEIGNEFTSDKIVGSGQCVAFDFFGGRLDPKTQGPLSPNFGSDFDEGVSFRLPGFGFAFKKKDFRVQSEIQFVIRSNSTGQERVLKYQLEAKGRDLFLAGEYKKIAVAIEIQKRETLRKALGRILPQIVEQFRKDLGLPTWETRVLGKQDNMWVLVGGEYEGVRPGLVLESSSGAIAEVMRVGTDRSFAKMRFGSLLPGESLRVQGGGPLALLTSPASRTLSIDLDDLSSPQDLEKVMSKCFGENTGVIDQFLNSVAYFYGLYRFKNVFDQPFAVNHPRGPLVALVGSGIYSKEDKLKKHLSSTGYDYISGDDRPSDELGVGTAAALLLQKLVPGDFGLVPYKVIGPRGETNSAALFEALRDISLRRDIEWVVMPYHAQVPSEALRMGLDLVLRSGKKVIVPDGLSVPGAIRAPSGKAAFETKGLGGAQLRLPADGVGVIEALAKEF